MLPGRCLFLIAVLVTAGACALMPNDNSATGALRVADQKKKQSEAKPKPGSRKAIRLFMRQKLQAMRLVLKGIVTEDYESVGKNAAAMKRMGTAAEWNVVQGPIYGSHRDAFERSADLLEKAAKDKNADGAMLVYMQMTLNCIECHRYTREPKVREKFKLD